VLAVDAHNRQTIPFTPDEIEVWGTIALSPDMKRIAMYCYYPEREPDGTPIAGTGWSGICLQNTDGSGFTRLLEKYDTALYSIGGVLAWSYDGQFIVFQGVPEDEISGRIELYSVDVITGRHQQLTTIDTDIGTNQIRCMSASPDGRWLAMMLNWDIYLLELNTMEFSHFVRGGCPTWLHDGSAMIFAKSTGEGIVRLSLEDKTEQVLVVRNRLWCPSPSGGLALSPDEEQLVFTDACGEEHHDLWLLHIASGDVVPLISSSQLGPQDARFPVWVVIP
jgi:Tol biopolymer transport system component